MKMPSVLSDTVEREQGAGKDKTAQGFVNACSFIS